MKHQVKRGRPKKLWGFDSEFKGSAKLEHPEYVWMLQFSDGKENIAFRDPHKFAEWFCRRRPSHVFAFNLPAELGSLHAWGFEPKIRKIGIQYRGKLEIGGHKALFYDLAPLAWAMGLKRVADVGAYLNFPKLETPKYLLENGPQTPEQWEETELYGIRDAQICQAFAYRIQEELSKITGRFIDVTRLYSGGTIASLFFGFPKRLETKKIKPNLWEIQIPKKEALLRAYATFAGRSEVFETGWHEYACYSDISSLYPLATVATRAMMISDVVFCDFNELEISDDPCCPNHGWIKGVFETKEDTWGLPFRWTQMKKVIYVKGEIGRREWGVFHTMDLAAANAKVLQVDFCMKPVFDDSPKAKRRHELFRKLTHRRLTQKITKEEKALLKSILNPASGKLGQTKPRPARTTNYPAYSALLACSHLIFRNAIYNYPGEIYQIDTDGIIGNKRWTGTIGWIVDEGVELPIKLKVEGEGECFNWRSKRYILGPNENGEYKIARHGWRYGKESWMTLAETPDFLETTKEIRWSLNTQEKAAKALEIGRWTKAPRRLASEDLHRLLEADIKRKRASYDSYQLTKEKNTLGSDAWKRVELLSLPVEMLKKGYISSVFDFIQSLNEYSAPYILQDREEEPSENFSSQKRHLPWFRRETGLFLRDKKSPYIITRGERKRKERHLKRR